MSRETSTRRRWLPRFSLRTLLIVVTLICVVLGAVTPQLIEYRRQRELVERIPRISSIWVSWEKQTPAWLRWINNWPISEPFQRVAGVGCKMPSASSANEIADLMRQLPTVNAVYLADSCLTDELLICLATSKQLKELTIRREPLDTRYMANGRALQIYRYFLQQQQGSTQLEAIAEADDSAEWAAHEQKLLDSRNREISQKLPGVVVQWETHCCSE